jgi:hypothetical protein
MYSLWRGVVVVVVVVGREAREVRGVCDWRRAAQEPVRLTQEPAAPGVPGVTRGARAVSVSMLPCKMNAESSR